MGIRVILGDEHMILRQGVKKLLDSQTDIQVVGDTWDGNELIRFADEMSPDIVILEVKLHGLSGIEVTRQIKTKSPHIKVIALSVYTDRRFIVGMLTAGASAFLTKDCALDELVRAIRLVFSGGTYLKSSIADIVIQDYFHHLSEVTSSPTQLLTNREQEILQLLAEGETVKRISEKLFLSVKTVETHRQHIMSKLNINTMADLVKYAIRKDWLHWRCKQNKR
jgi:DNA-binding NarL/FixJ family response regulator